MTAPVSPQPPKKTSLLAIFSLVLSFLCMPVGAVLGILALIRIHKDPSLGGRGLAIAGLAISGCMLLCVPIEAAIAIPNYMKFQARAKQSECKAALRAAYVSERARDEGFTSSVAQLGFEPDPAHHYAYFLGSPAVDKGDDANVVLPAAAVREASGGPADLLAFQEALARAGVTPGATQDGFTLACVGNVDHDDTLDVWSISSEDRPGIPAGTAHNDLNDVME